MGRDGPRSSHGSSLGVTFTRRVPGWKYCPSTLSGLVTPGRRRGPRCVDSIGVGTLGFQPVGVESVFTP